MRWPSKLKGPKSHPNQIEGTYPYPYYQKQFDSKGPLIQPNLLPNVAELRRVRRGLACLRRHTQPAVLRRGGSCSESECLGHRPKVPRRGAQNNSTFHEPYYISAYALSPRLSSTCPAPDVGECNKNSAAFGPQSGPQALRGAWVSGVVDSAVQV